jgi:hypothetical protein
VLSATAGHPLRGTDAHLPHRLAPSRRCAHICR